MANKIEKRKNITNEIFEELEKKYPVRSEKSGICYAQTMDYITLETESFNNAVFRKLVKQNNQILTVYILVRERMCTTAGILLGIWITGKILQRNSLFGE